MTQVVTFHGREVDLRKAVPLRLRDWKALEEKGVTLAQLANNRVSDMVTLMYHVLNKADSTVTMEEVMDLTMDDPIVMAVVECINTTQGKIDRPFSSSSTSSP